jgi:hypothetical protein
MNINTNTDKVLLYQQPAAKEGVCVSRTVGEVPSVMPAEDVVIFAEWELKAPK